MQSVTHVTRLREIALELRALGRVDHAQAIEWAMDLARRSTTDVAPVERLYEIGTDGRVVDAGEVAEPAIDTQTRPPSSGRSRSHSDGGS